MTATPALENADPLPTSAQDLMQALDDIGISYQLYEHAPVFTVAESSKLEIEIPGVDCRNLFLRDKKQAMFLVVAANTTRIDLKKLPAVLGSDRLSFGSPDRLWQYLGVRPGSVCPFAAINDKDKAVTVVLDAAMMGAEMVNYHPLENHMSLALAPADLIRFLEWTGHQPRIVDLGPAAPDDKGE